MMLLLRTRLLIISCLALVSCSKSKEEVTVIEVLPLTASDVRADIPSVYQPFFSPGFAKQDVNTTRSRLPFDSISISRTACLGTCPVYDMVLHRDGTAALNAQAHLPKLGKFIGRTHLNTYGRLCYLIENSHFEDMNTIYRANWTDDSTCIVTVTSGAKVKSVSDYGTVGPIELWAIQELLDAVKDEIAWKLAK